MGRLAVALTRVDQWGRPQEAERVVSYHQPANSLGTSVSWAPFDGLPRTLQHVLLLNGRSQVVNQNQAPLGDHRGRILDCLIVGYKS